MAQSTITAGDTFTFDITPLDATGATYDLTVGTWTCEVGVYRKGTEHIRKTITTTTGDNAAFTGFLTPTETSGLAPGIYTLAAQVKRTDSTPQIALEMQYSLNVTPEVLQ